MKALFDKSAPLVLSASRATDIPAFFGEWFENRLRAGFIDWRNPFSGRVTRVSLASVRAVVFWTKNPRPLFARLERLEAAGCENYYFQFTLNNYPAAIEPAVPDLADRIDAFRHLSHRLGAGRLVWRFDPVLIAPGLEIGDVLGRLAAVGDALAGFCDQLVFSFIDIEKYPRVKRNIAASGIPIREPDGAEREFFVRELSRLAGGWQMRVAACAGRQDFGIYGIEPGRCIDDRRLVRAFGHDRELLAGLSAGAEPDLFGFSGNNPLKDKGQRAACGCIASKDIGAYDSCGHGCVYCYANASPATARRFLAGHDPREPLLMSTASE